MNPHDVNNARQNKPTLIARDLLEFIPADVAYACLLRRGVFKWFAVRRDLIRLKDAWRDRVTLVLGLVRDAKKNRDYYQRIYYKGYLKALEKCRAEIRALCHSPRWRVQDNDREAKKFLAGVEAQLDGCLPPKQAVEGSNPSGPAKPENGKWHWVSSDGANWFPARRVESEEGAVGGWTNDDTWEDFDREIKYWIPLVDPNVRSLPYIGEVIRGNVFHHCMPECKDCKITRLENQLRLWKPGGCF